MNNAEKIKNMNTWELAEFIHDVSFNATKISTCENECAKCSCSDSYCVSNIAEYLLQEA